MKYINKFVVLIICFFISILSVSAEENILKTETKDKVIFIADEDGKFSYSWTFNKVLYNKSDLEFDLGIHFKTENEAKINNIIGQKQDKEFISFDYHGELPSSATIKVPVLKFKENDKLILYYYDDKTNEIVKIKSNISVINGFVTFNIDHCSDYFLMKSSVKGATNTNNPGIIIIGMLIVIVGLIGYTLFNKK